MAAPALEIVRVPVLSDNYAWLVFDPLTQEVAAVDPGEAEPVLAAAAARGWTVSQVWTTHWHPDHTGGNAAMKAAGATITGPRAERDRIPTLDTLVAEGDVVRIGSHTGHVLAVPGHTAGHVIFHHTPSRFAQVGDVLFQGSVGRTDLPQGNHKQLIESIVTKLWPLGDTHFIPGHGKPSTFAHERQHNMFVSDAALAA